MLKEPRAIGLVGVAGLGLGNRPVLPGFAAPASPAVSLGKCLFSGWFQSHRDGCKSIGLVRTLFFFFSVLERKPGRVNLQRNLDAPRGDRTERTRET